jgi:hypothetical protein
MDDGRPSFSEGVLCIPGQQGIYATLTLSNHRGDLESSTFEFAVDIPGVVMASGCAVHMEEHFHLASAWTDLPIQRHERFIAEERRSEGYEFALQIEHDGRGHYVMRITLRPLGAAASTSVSVKVLVEAEWVPRVSKWWEQFFRHPVAIGSTS